MRVLRTSTPSTAIQHPSSKNPSHGWNRRRRQLTLALHLNLPDLLLDIFLHPCPSPFLTSSSSPPPKWHRCASASLFVGVSDLVTCLADLYYVFFWIFLVLRDCRDGGIKSKFLVWWLFPSSRLLSPLKPMRSSCCCGCPLPSGQNSDCLDPCSSDAWKKAV